MALERGSFKFGAAEFPLTVSTTNTLREDADPALHHAMLFLAAAFETYFGARLLAQAALHGLALPGAVVATMGIEPSPFLLQDKFKFPLFALYRVKDVWDEHTVAFDKSTSVWEFCYLLPPLTPVQADALAHILRAASITLRRVIHMGQDPGYQSNAPVWGPAGIMKARLVECAYGGWEQLPNLDRYYRALTGTIAVLEREMPLTSTYENFAGADVEGPIKDGTGTVVESLTDFNTYESPTIISVTPATGNAAGGETVFIAGTGFRVGARYAVLFDGAAADAVVVINSATLRCVNPAHVAFPSFAADIRVIAPDGQTDTLASGFTYTDS